MKRLTLLMFIAARAWANDDAEVYWNEEERAFYVVDPVEEESQFRYDAYTPGGESTKSHSGTLVRPSFSGPNKATFVVSAKVSVGEANWSGNHFTPTLEITAVMKRGAKSWPVVLPREPTEVRVWWSPDGRRALVASSSAFSYSGGYAALVPGPLPRVQVLYPPGGMLTSAQLQQLDALAAPLGCVVSYAGEAKKARPTTVIYADKGFEKQAKALAEKVPGGATVEPRTWASNASLVVAIGDSYK